MFSNMLKLLYWHSLRKFFRKIAIQKTSLINVISYSKKKNHIFKEKVSAVEKESPLLVLPHLGTISLQTRTKLQKSIKVYLTAVIFWLFLKDKINSVIIFAPETLFPKLLHQVWFTSFSANYAMNPITENQRMCQTLWCRKWWTYWYFTFTA